MYWFFIDSFHLEFFSAFVQVEAGDVIVKVNGIDVHRYTTKEGIFFLQSNNFYCALYDGLIENIFLGCF